MDHNVMTNTKQTAIAPAGQSSPAPQPSSATPKHATKAKAASRPKPTSGHQSKQDRVLGMLRQKGGATVAAVMKATGWQTHSVRGFFAGVVRKKLKLNLVFQKTNGKRIYRIAAGKPVGANRAKRKRAH